MNTYKRWVPLLGVAVLVAVAVLKVFGLEELAATVSSFGGLLGWTGASPVGGLEVGAAVAALTGIVLKIRAIIKGK